MRRINVSPRITIITVALVAILASCATLTTSSTTNTNPGNGNGGGGNGTGNGGGAGGSGNGYNPSNPSPGANAPNLAQYVNPFIGTTPGDASQGQSKDSANDFPGAVAPLGMVQWSPDTPRNPPGGYYYGDNQIKGFSLTHFSGRGCQVYQDFPFIPFVGNLPGSPRQNGGAFVASFSHQNEQAQPGYYMVQLSQPNVKVELTATLRTGQARFTFPQSQQSTILINAGGSINDTTQSSVTIAPGGQSIVGMATSTVGCGGNHYTIYFSAHFDQPFAAYGSWNGGGLNGGSTNASGQHTGAYVTFDTRSNQVVQVRVGLSFVSTANAEANLAAESPTFSFDATRQATSQAWNNRLNAIVVQGGTNDERDLFYTALYHAFIHPNVFNDANGQYIGFDGQVHMLAAGHVQYENISSWDAYRSLMPLRAILFPGEMSDIAQSLINDAQQGDGHLPRWEQANQDSHGMNGDSATITVTDAYVYGATGFDTQAALNAMINGQSKIREHLNDYTSLGYVAASSANNSVDETLEYSNDDFALSQFAAALGQNAAATQYRQRSGSWMNVFNTGSGYVQPRNADGSWAGGFDPTSGFGFDEGDAVQYTWMVPFDYKDLAAKMGGNGNVVQRLDSFFQQLNDRSTSTHAWLGNEPSSETPWIYDAVGAPSHAQDVLRRTELTIYKNNPGGYPGNDDGGQMSAWYMFAALGIYPEIPGVAGFAVGSPLFTTATIHLGNGHTLTITGAGAADDAPYVQSLSLNGQATQNTWIPWSAVQNGGTLAFTLGTNATDWGSNNPLPSYAPGG